MKYVTTNSRGRIQAALQVPEFTQLETGRHCHYDILPLNLNGTLSQNLRNGMKPHHKIHMATFLTYSQVHKTPSYWYNINFLYYFIFLKMLSIRVSVTRSCHHLIATLQCLT